MFFGLSNAPASFQGYINKPLAKKLDVFVIVYLDDILIYIEDEGQGHVEGVQWVLDLLKKNGLFANLAKCRFYKDRVRFLWYVMSAQEVRMENKKIDVVKNWPEPKSVQDIQVFFGFANFYWCFIQGFSKIAVPLTLMLRTIPLVKKLSKLTKNNEVDGDHDEATISGDCEKMGEPKALKNSGYLTPNARSVFIQLR